MDADFDEEISSAAAVENGDALILDADGGAGLGAFGNLEGLIAAEGGDSDFRAERGLHERNGHDAAEVIAFALKKLMLFHMQNNVEIAGLAAEGSGFTEAGEADACAVFNAGGDFGFDGALTKCAALAAALQAGIGDDLTESLAGGTGACDAEKSLLMADLAVAVAGAAGYRGFPRSGAGAAAGFASFMAADGDGFFDAEDGLFKFQF